MTAVLLTLLALQIPDAPLKRGTLSFDGRATLGDFVGQTDSVRGGMNGGPNLWAVTGWVAANVTSLRTGNGKRDKDMRKSLEAEAYPTMRFDLKAVHPVRERNPHTDSTEVTLRGTLTLHGRTREVELPARVWHGLDGWRVRTDFPVNLKDYEIGGLSKLLGVLKMNEHITVHVDVTFGR